MFNDDDDELPVHPAAGDDHDLDGYVRAMPGGKYVMAHWRTEPMHLCAVTIHDARWLLKSVAAAYPPHRTSDSADTYVFAIPETIARCITWNADEGVHYACEFPGPAWCDDMMHIAGVIAETLTELEEVEAWADGLADLGPAAAAAHLDWKDVLRVIARLYADDPTAHPIYELIQPAIDALSAP